MALISPGVEVTVIDESFYTPAEPGTTPLIVVATAQDKSNAAGTGTAQGTLAANIGKAFRITSQRELVDLYGVPFFEQTASSSPVHGGERNEYGLLAAYSLLGVSNSVFITRANIDLEALEGTSTAPGAEPRDGSWWFDTRNTAWGIQEWNSAAITAVGGQKFANKIPLVLTNDDSTKLTGGVPNASFGAIGDYAVVAETGSLAQEQIKFYYKSARIGSQPLTAGTWVLVGSNDWTASHPTVYSSTTVESSIPAGTFTINGVTVNVGANLEATVTAINSLSIDGVSAVGSNGLLYLYTNGDNDDSQGDSSLSNAIVLGGTTAVLEDLGLTAGSYYGPALQQTPHTQVPEWKVSNTNPRPTGSVWIKTTEPNAGARWRVKRWSSATQAWGEVSSPLYSSTHAALYFLDRAGGGINLPVGTTFVQTNANEYSLSDDTPATAEFKIWVRAASGNTVIRSSIIAAQLNGSQSFQIKEFLQGELSLSANVSVSFTGTGVPGDAQLMAAAINAAGLQHVEADVSVDNELIIFHKTGGDFRITDGTGTPIADLFGTGYNVITKIGTVNFYAAPAGAAEDFIASNWISLTARNFSSSPDQPLQEPADGQLWYNPALGEVDIMVHDGDTFVGYKTEFPSTDPAGPQVAATAPTEQSDGTILVTGDLWISTADLENYPTIYRWDADLLEWSQLDTSDQTTEDGVLFADARYGSSGANGDVAATIVELLTSNYLDPDAPDPDLYPKGMLLWNLRRSSGNVKRYENNYINVNEDNTRFNNQSMSAYATDRWVTASPNNENGSGSFGRKAQRAVIVQSLKSVVDTSEEIRDEERRNFNLIACPGYPELLSNLVNLNIDRGLTAFVVGDTPLRLRNDSTTLTNWGTNARLVTDNGDDGIVTFDEYAAVFYPNGFTTDLGGANVVVPASHMMLRTIALSDQVSYPWFAPAGTRRGGITNATSVGYIDAATGEFQTVALNNGQRDTLYDLKVNPIPFFVGVGHVAYGQKTRARNASALDRINVARLVVYLRSQLNKLARPYIFEPNDKITRDEVKGAVESLLLELVGLRALYDFAVVCDESNNTPARIDRNELYVDIAIEPVKAVEFIYIPLRVKNTGEI
jgi:hypothetical protein